jgi:hypothetical protein
MTSSALNLRPSDAARPSSVPDSILKQFPKFQPSSEEISDCGSIWPGAASGGSEPKFRMGELRHRTIRARQHATGQQSSEIGVTVFSTRQFPVLATLSSVAAQTPQRLRTHRRSCKPSHLQSRARTQEALSTVRPNNQRPRRSSSHVQTKSRPSPIPHPVRPVTHGSRDQPHPEMRSAVEFILLPDNRCSPPEHHAFALFACADLQAARRSESPPRRRVSHRQIGRATRERFRPHHSRKDPRSAERP